MNHGNKTNAQIRQLIFDGLATFGDEVYSLDWEEVLVYDGVVFKSKCSCNYVGTQPQCNAPGCPPVIEAVGSFIDLGL